MRLIDRLSDIAETCDALLCDAWGVIHDGVRVFPGAAEALTEFRRSRGPVVVVTNAPRLSAIIPPQLDRLGLPRSAYDAVVSSGDATRAAIERRLPQRAFKLGPAKDETLYSGLAIEFAPLDKAEFIICTGLVDDAREKPEDYAGLLAEAAARRLPMICANPDILVRWGGRLVYCAGALAEIYLRLGAEVIFGGKPHPPIYDLALQAVDRAAGRPIAPSRVLAVGDGAATDIAGANRIGLPALYIAHEGGVHEGDTDAQSIAQALDRAGAKADFAATRLAW
jgi:HAD superfamily hydrolase (TIGR01459 family)